MLRDIELLSQLFRRDGLLRVDAHAGAPEPAAPLAHKAPQPAAFQLQNSLFQHRVEKLGVGLETPHPEKGLRRGRHRPALNETVVFEPVRVRGSLVGMSLLRGMGSLLKAKSEPVVPGVRQIMSRRSPFFREVSCSRVRSRSTGLREGWTKGRQRVWSRSGEHKGHRLCPKPKRCRSD